MPCIASRASGPSDSISQTGESRIQTLCSQTLLLYEGVICLKFLPSVQCEYVKICQIDVIKLTFKRSCSNGYEGMVILHLYAQVRDSGGCMHSVPADLPIRFCAVTDSLHLSASIRLIHSHCETPITHQICAQIVLSQTQTPYTFNPVQNVPIYPRLCW